jgi:hypothetical protein
MAQSTSPNVKSPIEKVNSLTGFMFTTACVCSHKKAMRRTVAISENPNFVTQFVRAFVYYSTNCKFANHC